MTIDFYQLLVFIILLQESNLKENFKECIDRLNERKNICEEMVKSKPTLYSVLKGIHEV